MKALAPFRLEVRKCKKELISFRRLLNSKNALTEAGDILPFFKKHKHLAALIGSFNPRISRFDRLATGLNLFGDYASDLVIGDSGSGNYCFVEFEDAFPTSIFARPRYRSTPEWSHRFEHGFSQIVDWFQVLEDQKRTGLHKARFGADLIQYVGVLVIGRRKDLDDTQYERLVWRSEQVRVGARQVHCVTYDELYETLALKVEIFG